MCSCSAEVDAEDHHQVGHDAARTAGGADRGLEQDPDDRGDHHQSEKSHDEARHGVGRAACGRASPGGVGVGVGVTVRVGVGVGGSGVARARASASIAFSYSKRRRRQHEHFLELREIDRRHHVRHLKEAAVLARDVAHTADGNALGKDRRRAPRSRRVADSTSSPRLMYFIEQLRRAMPSTMPRARVRCTSASMPLL